MIAAAPGPRSASPAGRGEPACEVLDLRPVERPRREQQRRRAEPRGERGHRELRGDAVAVRFLVPRHHQQAASLDEPAHAGRVAHAPLRGRAGAPGRSPGHLQPPPAHDAVDLGAHPEPLEVDARLDREARALAEPPAIGELHAVEVHPVAVHPGADRVAGPVTQARRRSPGGDHVAGRPIHLRARDARRRGRRRSRRRAASRAATTAANTRSCSAVGPRREHADPGDVREHRALARLPRPQVELHHVARREPPAPPDGLVVRIGARLPRGDEHRAVAHQARLGDEPGDPLLHVRLVHGPAVGERGTDPAPGVVHHGVQRERGPPVRGLRLRVERAEAVDDEVLGRRQPDAERARAARAVPWSRKEITGKDVGELRREPGPRRQRRDDRRDQLVARGAAHEAAREVVEDARLDRVHDAGRLPRRRQDPGPRPAVVRRARARRARGRRSRPGGTGYKKAIRRGRPPGWPERCARRPVMARQR